MPRTIQVGTSSWYGVSEDGFTFLNGRVADERCLPDYQTPLNPIKIGESINESEIVINETGSAGLSIKGHHPKKDGIPACLLAAKAVTARGACLTWQSSLRGGFSSSNLRGIS